MRHWNAAVIAAVTFAVASATAIVPPPPAHGATASVPSDYNGDGYADLAVGVPGQDLGGFINVGQVNVIYGSATGLTAAGDQVWWQGSPGIEGVPQGRAGPPGARLLGDAFGGRLASGDFDGDGYADLAVTSTYDRENGDAHGAVNVIYGGPTGLDATDDQLFSPANLPDGVRDVGGSLETGDFDGDGYADLALSVATLNEASPFLERTAGAIVLRGSGTGLTLTDRTELWMGTPGLPDPASIFCCMVMLAAGDADGDGDDELAMGFPDLSVDAKEGVGAVTVVPGSPDGLDATQAQTFSQDTPGVPGEACGTTGSGCLNEWFGFALEFADFSGDGYDDLAVGMPRESAGALSEGAVVVLLGSASGVTATGSQLWMQGTPGVPGNGEPFDEFGYSLVAADFDVDGRADLAIGTPLEDFGGVSSAGVVTVLRGAAAGLTATGAQQWSQDSAGVPGVAEPDGFGSTLAAGDFGRSAGPDLAVGVEGEEAGGEFATGIVDVLYARTGGLSGSGAQSWWLDSPGIKGVAQRRSVWGSALAPR